MAFGGKDEDYSSFTADMQNLMSNWANQAPKMVARRVVPIPEPLNIKSGDIRANFEFFKEAWSVYYVASELNLASEEIQVANLKAVLGGDAFKLYVSLDKTGVDVSTCEAVLKFLEETWKPRKSKMVSRAEFNTCFQHKEEPFSQYLVRLKQIITDCQYGNMKDELLCDRIVVGIVDQALREKLLEKEDELNLANCLKVCKAQEASINYSSIINQTTQRVKDNEVMQVWAQKPREKFKNKENTSLSCKFCLGKHEFKKELCPAWGKKCRKCKKIGHFELACFKLNKKQFNEMKNETQDEEESDEGELMIRSIKTGAYQEGSRIFAEVELFVNNYWLEWKCQLDTGADESVIGMETLKKLLNDDEPKIKKTMQPLYNASKEKMEILGEITIAAKFRGRKRNIKFYVMPLNHRPMLSGKMCVQLKLIKLCEEIKIGENDEETYKSQAKEIVKKYWNVFQGLGEFEGEVELEIDEAVKPVIEAPRRFPLNVKEALKQELGRLEKMGVIVQEPNHTQWCSNILLVKRNGKHRLCLDPSSLNKALKRPNFQFSTVDELTPELEGAKVFTKVDAAKGFHQLKLTEESSKLTTFWTPFGRFRWTRLPFGIKSAPEIFQMRQQEMLADLQGTYVMADDVLVTGKGETMVEALKDHNSNLERLLHRLSLKGCKLNEDKLALCQPEIVFFGHVLCKEGLKPDPAKVEAIEKFKRPENQEAVLRFLGMVNYLAKFVPNLSATAEPLRVITRKDETFRWTQAEEDCFKKIIASVTKTVLLQFVSLKSPLVIETDASSFGLGSVLLQKNLPVYFASRTLTSAEKNYSQIEKELLAIVFACKRFDQYLAGSRDEIIVRSDHKPLEEIQKKPIHKVTKRLQVMLMALQRYRIRIVHVPGKLMVLSDTLSRAPLDTTKINFKSDVEVFEIKREQEFKEIVEQANMSSGVRIASKQLDRLRAESRKDQVTRKLQEFINLGWPDHKLIPDEMKPYEKFKEELSTEDGLVFKLDRILVPLSLRKEFLEKLHANHMGMETTRNLARDTIFWPGINDQIKQKVNNCESCLKYSGAQRKLPMQSHPIPVKPFEYVSMDLFEVVYKGKKRYFLIIVDHYSDYFELEEITDMTSVTVINKCNQQFARHGLPKECVTDGGPCFQGKFKEFLKELNVGHRASSPHHQQGNGKAESAVKIAKQIIKKCDDDNSNVWMALLNYRNTPNKIGSSPNQRMFSRRTRALIPVKENKLDPRVEENVPEAIKNRRENTARWYNQNTTKHPEMEEGQTVYFKLNPQKEWTPGRIKRQEKDRAYIVETKEGGEYVRNREHIKPYETGNDGSETPEDIYNEESHTAEEEQLQQQQDNSRPVRNTKLPEHLKDYVVEIPKKISRN